MRLNPKTNASYSSMGFMTGFKSGMIVICMFILLSSYLLTKNLTVDIVRHY